MRVIGVLDLRRGRAVHARAGQRSAYRLLRSPLAPGAGDAVAIARAYRATLGLRDLYVADLDAITQGALVQHALLRELAHAFGGGVLVDAGISAAAPARRLVEHRGASCAVVGLETLRTFRDLERIVRAVGGGRVAFSLDLRNGAPLVRRGAAHGGTPLALAQRAAAAGVEKVIVLDLARVGMGQGPDLALVGSLARAVPEVELLAGGGVRDRRDLERLADAGAHGALVATALHDGRVTARDVEAVRARGR
ncbi:MAG: HisA/HisF-related TIM barrel protein [Gemmatimonadaceae bacterium]